MGRVLLLWAFRIGGVEDHREKRKGLQYGIWEDLDMGSVLESPLTSATIIESQNANAVGMYNHLYNTLRL